MIPIAVARIFQVEFCTGMIAIAVGRYSKSNDHFIGSNCSQTIVLRGLNIRATVKCYTVRVPTARERTTLEYLKQLTLEYLQSFV
jgi:hypothetical protein